MDETVLWLWLSLHFGAGNNIYQKLYDHFGSIEAIFDCDDSDVASIDWLVDYQKKKLLDKNIDHAKEVLDWCNYYGVNIITYSDSNFPKILRDINKCPIVLYYLGELPNFDMELCISVVGTRKMTMYGQNVSYDIGYGLAKAGAIVVSGMALGIDCTAQKGALYAGGKAIAVLGSGIDVVYPQKNYALYQKIARVGAVITEFPPHTPPSGANFPIRNRIISALSSATLVVEADINSGALITAKYALSQGRKLFAVPGPIRTTTSSGTNSLIRDGAKAVTSATDIVEEFLDKYGDKIDISASKLRPVIKRNEVKFASAVQAGKEFYKDYNDPQNTDGKANFVSENQKKDYKSQKIENNDNKSTIDISTLSEHERKVYEFMEFNKLYSTDDIDVPDMSIADIMSAMTMLEMAGAISEIPGGFFVKK